MRVVTRLERRYAEFDGLNLTWESLEGIVKHNGPLLKDERMLADLPAGHFDVLWPWPEEIAKAVASQQWRGGEPTPGFDAALRDQAHDLIVAFHRRQLLP